MRRLAGLTCAALLAATSALANETVPVELGQARVMAINALNAGDPEFAVRIGKGLLLADPHDGEAWFLLAAGYRQLGDSAATGHAAARAYRFSKDPRARLRAAEMAARASLERNRPTMTQFWLRRAATNSENPATDQKIARDYARVREINPFSFRLSGGVSPSSNVNGGADSALQIIDGVPFVGTLSPSAQALSGTVVHADLQLRYRIAGSETSRTDLGARLYTRQVRLSDDAKAMAPLATNDDFASSVVELSLDHRFALGDERGQAGLGFALGRAWSADVKSFDYARLSAERGLRLGNASSLGLSFSIEARDSERSPVLDETRITLGSRFGHKLENGDRLSLGLTLQDVAADHVSVANRSAILRGAYSFARKLGPAEVTAGLTLGYSDYPTYTALFVVPGGRQDTSTYADVSFFFSEYDYAGFAPTVRLRTGRRSSNVSRFDTRETSLSLEIRSKF